MPEVYSYSRLNSYGQCPYAWALTYNDGNRGIGSCFAEYGTLMHSLFERYAKGELELGNLKDVFEWEFDDAITTPWMKTKNGSLRDSYYQNGLDFFDKFDGFGNIEIVGIEEHFKIKISDFYLQGYIDQLYIDSDGEYVVRDFKSGKNWTKAQVKEHARQLYLYSGYVKEKYGVFPKAVEFYMFRDGKRHIIPFDINEYNEAVAWACNQVDIIRNSWDYEKNPEYFYCINLCSHRDECIYGKPWYWKKNKEN